MDRKSSIILSVSSILILGLGTLIGIMLVKGYTFNTTTKKIESTGVLIVNSVPSGAQIFIDDHYQNVTNTSIPFLPTRDYKIRLTKEGYTPWEKDMTIDSQLTSEIEAIMWPAIPSVNPITNTGVVNVQISPDKQKVVYGVKFSERDKAGLWVMDMAKKTVFSGTSTDFTQIARNTGSIDYSKAELTWSPDSKQIVATLQENENPDSKFTRNYLLDTTRLNSNPNDITLTKEGTYKGWMDEIDQKNNIRNLKLALDPEGLKLASDSAIPVRWSWDETMFLYATSNSPSTQSATIKPSNQPKVIKVNTTKSASESAQIDVESATSSASYKKYVDSQTSTFSADLNIKVYDLKKKKSFDLPFAKYFSWYPAEEKADREIQHLIMIENGSISIIETDGKNKSTIYGGPFEDSIVFPWPDGGRLVFLTNFNNNAGSEPNLYTINLR
jgi:hypothetical protein